MNHIARPRSGRNVSDLGDNTRNRNGVTTRGLFARHQHEYAARGIPTFPVRIDGSTKRPIVRGYLNIGQRRSQLLAKQFSEADAFGFAVGKRNGVTVLDVDSADERVLADALDCHGKSPLIIRSGGHGHFQAWYRWNGETRQIRPDKSKPIDVLGAGYVVAPPSRGVSRNYEIISGSLYDLDRLPVLSGLDQLRRTETPLGWREMGDNSGRNNALFRRLGREAHACDDFDQLLDRAITLNEQFAAPMEDKRVIAVARSVWTMTLQGRNRFGQHGSFIGVAEVDRLVSDPYLLALLNWLRAHQGPDSVFMIADGLAETLQWSRRRFADARRKIIEQGIVSMVSPPSKGRAARYVWGGGRSEEITFVENLLPESVGLKSTLQACGGAA